MDNIKKYNFELPMPLSVNILYRMAFRDRRGKPLKRPHMYMTTEGKDLKEELIWMICDQANKQSMPHWKDTIIIAEITPYNLRKSADTNNLHKLIWDAFEESGRIDNDKHLIERTLNRKLTPDKVKRIEVSLYECKGKPTDEDIKKYFWWWNNEC